MTTNKTSSSVRQFANRLYSYTTADQLILTSRFLIVLNYLIIFLLWQLKEYNSLYLAIIIVIFVYGLICLFGSRFFNYRMVNLVLTIFDSSFVSFGFYHLQTDYIDAGYFIYFIGILISVFYGGYFSSVGLSILATCLFSLAVLPGLAPENSYGFYFRILNLNLTTILICISGLKIKQAIKLVENEKDESKKQFHQLQILSRIAKEINGELEIEKLLLLIVQKAGELTKSQASGIILRDNDQIYRIKATNGMPKTFWEKEISPGVGLPGKVLTEKKTVFEKNLAYNSSMEHPIDLEHHRFAMASPIWWKGEIIGLIFLLRGCQNAGFTKDDKLLLETLSEHAASAVANAKLFKLTTTLSLNDYLTGVGNLRFFFQQLEHTFAVAERYQQPFSLMVVDSDSLKQINDQYGNAQGFRHIKQLAEILKNSIRNSDLIARYDRDMFMIILPQTNLPETINLAERIRSMVAESPLIIDGQSISTTVCIGLASYPDHANNIQTLIALVENTLYKAKRLGKNQMVTAG